MPGYARENNDTEDDIDMRLTAQVLRALVADGKITDRKIGFPTGLSIPYDVTGRIDVDYFNKGPVISPLGQATMAPYLSSIHGDDKKRQRRDGKRNLARFSLPLPEPKAPEIDGISDTLWDQRERLSRCPSLSSVSDISQDHCDISSRYDLCSPDCWLYSDLSDHSNILTEKVRGLSLRAHKPDTTSTTAQIYEKVSSGQARILHLEPGLPEEPIKCSLSLFDLSRDSETQDLSRKPFPEYEALSYTWGDPTPYHTVVCNTYTFPVAKNLFFALKHLRASHRSRSLWIDAICINQGDVVERNEQVRYMTSIYRGAKSVIVWLGNDEENSDLAMEAMKFMMTRENRGTIFKHTHRKSCIDRLYEMYIAQIQLFKRSWFRRSWIRQEISTAKRVHVQCGNKEISWTALKRAFNMLWRLNEKLRMEGMEDLPFFDSETLGPLRFLRRNWSIGQPLISGSGDIRSIWYYHAGGILDLLMVGRKFETTDPRDKVYSVLGIGGVPIEGNPQSREGNCLSEGPRTLAMRVNYTASVSEVYQRLAKYIINRDLNLDILCILSTHRDSNSHDLPTWTPDWRVPTSSISLYENWHYLSYKFGASGPAGYTKALEQDDNDLGRLKVEGFVIDQLIQIHDTTIDPPHIPIEAMARVRNAEPSDLSRFAATASGRESTLVPRTARAFDLVVILHGAKLPFIVRLREGQSLDEPEVGKVYLEQGWEFEVVGPCWIPNVMWGKVFEGCTKKQMRRMILV
jgi:hypothetical protein